MSNGGSPDDFNNQLGKLVRRLALLTHLLFEPGNYQNDLNEIKNEINAQNGCWCCLTSAALVLLLDALDEMHDGDSDAVTGWLERKLAAELDAH